MTKFYVYFQTIKEKQKENRYLYEVAIFEMLDHIFILIVEFAKYLVMQ
jgi:hypothetical protein